MSSQPKSTIPDRYHHDAARARYTLGSQVWTYDPDDARSRHEAHAAAAEALQKLHGGRDPLLERIRAKREQLAAVAQQFEGQAGGYAVQDADGNVNWGSGPARKAVA
jgi:hypothetical protein